jgi:acetolactate synthase I/II/III large subunit
VSDAPTSAPRGVYSLITAELLANGVDKIFGLVGEDTVVFMADATAAGIQYFGTRHEAGAVAMADGYSWATGEMGVCTVTRGPGVTNAMTAFRTAANGRRKVLVLTGDIPTDGSGPYLKNVDQGPICRGVGMEYFDARVVDDVVPQLRRALAKVRDGYATVFAVPTNILNTLLSDGEGEFPPSAPSPPLPAPQSASKYDVEAIADRLLASSRPLIVAGLGAVAADCRERLIQVAERTGALLCTTLPAKGLFLGSEFDAGIIGGYADDPTMALIDGFDLIVAVGASLNPYSLAQNTLFRGVPIIQIDHDAERIGMTRPVELKVVGDAGLTLDGLLKTLDARPKREVSALHESEVLEGLRAPSFSGTAENTAQSLDPRAVATSFDRMLPADRVVVLDSGRFSMGPGRYVDIAVPGSVRPTAEAGSIGMGLGIALGAAVGRPERTTVLFAGDGGFSMALAELETAARHQLNLVAVVMDDHAYGSEMRHLSAAGLPVEMSKLPIIDFAGVARALGIQSATARTQEDLDYLEPFLKAPKGPMLIHCYIRDDLVVPSLVTNVHAANGRA